MMRSVLIGLVLLDATFAKADPVSVRVGDHPTFGRLVIHLSAAAPASVKLRGNRVEIGIANTEVGTPDRVPRNVIAFAGGHNAASISVVPGARIRSSQVGEMLIIDVVDPASRLLAETGRTRINPASTLPTLPPQMVAERSTRMPAAAPEPQPPPAVEPASPPALAGPVIPKPAVVEPEIAEAVAPEPVAASPLPSAADPVPEPATLLPIRITGGPEVGAVAFRHGDVGIIVFDEKIDVNPAEIPESPRHVETRQLQRGTIITVPLAQDETLALNRDQDGWVIELGAARAAPAVETAVADGIAFQFAQPGRAMTITDPVTDQVMLLGTVRKSAGDRTAIAARRSAPGYVLLPSFLGLALEVSADAVDLRTSLAGFTLQSPDRTAPARIAAPVRDNRLGIPNAPADVLMRQLNGQIASAAAAPPRSRGPERVAAARTMLALGMAAEAQALLSLASNDDPAIASDPSAAVLSGVAAVLANRVTEADGLDNPAVAATEDVLMWRALRDAAQTKPSPTLAAAMPVLASYPDAIRRQIAPPVIEAAIKAGAPVPASELNDPALAMARATQKAASGDVEPALEELDAIVQGRDERQSVRAAVAAAELRLSKGQIDATAAADRIDRQTLRWRGDGQEIAMRLRVAELRAQAAQWRGALDSLTQTQTIFPDAKPRIAALKAGVFRSLLAADSKSVNPLELVAVAGDFADSLPDGADGERLAGLLADKLAALDLPTRAIPVLQRLMDHSDTPARKAEFALRLAQLQLDAGDPAKAESALDQLDPTTLEPANAEKRTFMLARTKADRGDPAGAAQLLTTIDSPASDEARAALLAKAGDWRGSLRALQSLAAKTVPDQGALNDRQQDVVLRQATAAVQAGDADALSKLKRYDPRLTTPRTDLFRLLTASAVQGPEDLPRAAKELALSRALPNRLSALKLQ